MKSIALRVACAWFVFSACGGAEDSGATTMPFTTTNADGGEAPMDRCLGDAFADDFAVQAGDGETVSGHIEALASSTHGVVACGDGFLDIVGGGSVELGGMCSSIATDGDLAIVGLRSSGVALVDLSGPSVVGTADVGGDVRGVAIRGTQAWAAAGASGVVALDASSGLASSGAVGSIVDARGVAIDDDGLWVAAGDAGVALLDPASGSTLANAATDSRALGVRTTAEGTIVLRGVFGWDVFAASGSALEKSASHETTGAVFDAAVHDGEIVTAEVHALVRHGDATRFEERPSFGDLEAPWLRSVASHDGELFVALGDEVAPVDVASTSDAPDIMVDATTVYMWGDAGERQEVLVVVDNLGDAPLVIGSIDADAPFAFEVQDGGMPIDGCPDAFEVEAGGSLLLAVSYTPDDTSLVTGEIVLHTNDPDEPELVLTVDGNRGEPEIGDEAVDFALVTIDGDLFRLSDHLGKVVLVKMFNFGCKRCAEEFGQVQSDVMPGYSSADFVAVGVNTTHRTAFAGTLAADADLTLPLALDIDSGAFRFYRMPEKVFPLNAIVGRDGRLTHVDAEEGLDAAQQAIDAAM